MTNNFMNDINKSVQIAVQIKEMLASQDDQDQEEAWYHIEQETDLLKIIDWFLTKEADAKAMQASIGERINQLRERKQSYERRAEWYRTTLLWIMNQLDQDKVIRPEATITRKAVAPKPVVVDENAVPAEFKEVVYKIDKQKINGAIAAGRPVSGVQMDNGNITITIRRK